MLCPEDTMRAAWQSDPMNFNNLPGVPSPAPPGRLSNADKRWPYSSSYRYVSHAWSNDVHSSSSGAWYFYNLGSATRDGGFKSGGEIGKRRMDQVAFPGQKVVMYDDASRHFSPRQVYWGFPGYKQPALMFDGTTQTIHTGAANLGFDHNQGLSNPATYSYNYTNAAWMPQKPESITTPGYLFSFASWATTRAGLEGRDINGPEVFTHSLTSGSGDHTQNPRAAPGW